MPTSRWRAVRIAAVCIASLAAVGSAPEDRGRRDSGIEALAPYEILAEGFHHIAGIAVDPDGAVLVVEKGGAVRRIERSGSVSTLPGHLHDPVGVAVDAGGGVLVLEEGGGRLLRLGSDGSTGLLAAGLKQPRAIAVGPDGQIWIATERAVARFDGGRLDVFATGFVDVQAIAVDRLYVYVAMKRLAREHGPAETMVARVSLLPNGSSGPEAIPTAQLSRANSIAIDTIGAIVVGGMVTGGPNGAIVKLAAASAAIFAAGLAGTVSVAFARAGDLVAAEDGPRGRVIRFHAPAMPDVATPLFTNRSPVAIAGRATAGDLIEVVAESDSAVGASTLADSGTGQFAVSVPVLPDAATDWLVRATGAGGAGLAGAARAVHVVHDGHIPHLEIVEPRGHTFSGGVVSLRAIADDDGTGISSMRLMLDDAVVTAIDNPDPAMPFVASASFDSRSIGEGPHAFTAAASDRAGNEASVAQLLVVDSTAPDTRIVTGPPPETVDKTVSFVVAGEDALSPAFTFSWRLDGDAWSPYGPATIAIDGLAPGPHRFEVRARDEAGNEDPTPAVQDFTVRSLEIRIVDPSGGTVVGGDYVWLRGTVGGAGGDVSVSVSFGTYTVAASVEGGMFATQVPVDPSITNITAVATDSSGASVQTTVSVTFVPDGTSTESLNVWPPGGLAPLKVGIRHGFHGARVAVDIEGDGVNEFDGVADDDYFYATYMQAGVYVPTVRFTTSTGTTIVRRGLVEVYDGQRLDERLQAAWRGFKDALRSGNIEAAVGFIVADRRAAWTEFFSALPPDAFQDVDRVFTTITFVNAGYGGAEYEMLAERDGVMTSFPIWFQLDSDGRWRLWRF